MNLPAAVRRHWAWWMVMAVAVVGVLVLAGTQAPVSGTGDDRLYGLGEQLKCLQCVGESVAASQAPLAQQFREEIRTQMAAGSTDDEILNFFVDRYGSEVLLEPPATGFGAVVWVLPVLVVGAAIVGLGFAFVNWRARSLETGRSPDTEPAIGEQSDDEVLSGAGAQALRQDEPGEKQDFEPESSTSRWRAPLVGAGVVGFLVLAAWLVVGGSDDRGGGELTGGTGTIGAALSRCQPQAAGDMAAAIDCYDAILADSPDNVEALSYRGWALVRSGQTDTAIADLQRAVELDPNYPDVRVFLASAASEQGDFATAAAELSEFWANDPTEVAVSVVQSEGLERTVFFGIMSAPTRNCWQVAAQSGDQGAIDQAFLDSLGACLDLVLTADGSDADARLSRALSHVGGDTADPVAAVELLDGLLLDDPSNADALALLVSLDLAAGDLDAASTDLEALEDLPRGYGAFLIGDAATLRAEYVAAKGNALPNPDGG